ncbi:MAG: hypothetical protein LBV34_27145 [Nocardiopsaceae bacterium]|jgi:hypothetical protein|nr:hypothetical protein [Nocardiopsaceae bacterium]
MTNTMAPTIPLAMFLFAGVVAVALRAAARRLEPQRVPGAQPAGVTVTADQGRPRPAVSAGVHDGAGREVARTPAAGRPARAVAQAQLIFHELHADGRNTLCGVCDVQYESV